MKNSKLLPYVEGAIVIAMGNYFDGLFARVCIINIEIRAASSRKIGE